MLLRRVDSSCCFLISATREDSENSEVNYEQWSVLKASIMNFPFFVMVWWINTPPTPPWQQRSSRKGKIDLVRSEIDTSAWMWRAVVKFKLKSSMNSDLESAPNSHFYPPQLLFFSKGEDDCPLFRWDFIHFASDGQIRWIHRVWRGQVRRDMTWTELWGTFSISAAGTTHCSLAILSKLPFKNSSLPLLAFTPVVNNHWSLWLDPLTWRPSDKRHPVVFGSRLHLSWSVTTGQEMLQAWPERAGSEHLPQVHTFIMKH